MRTTHKRGDMTATRERGPTSGVANVDGAALVLAYLSHQTGGWATEPRNTNPSNGLTRGERRHRGQQKVPVERTAQPFG